MMKSGNQHQHVVWVCFGGCHHCKSLPKKNWQMLQHLKKYVHHHPVLRFQHLCYYCCMCHLEDSGVMMSPLPLSQILSVLHHNYS